MPRTDQSIAILTGMIIAALYVILLVGFSQESYMRRDAASRPGDTGVWPASQDDSRQLCRVEPPARTVLAADLSALRSCMTSIDAVRWYLSDPRMPLTLEAVRRAMNEPGTAGVR